MVTSEALIDFGVGFSDFREWHLGKVKKMFPLSFGCCPLASLVVVLLVE